LCLYRICSKLFSRIFCKFSPFILLSSSTFFPLDFFLLRDDHICQTQKYSKVNKLQLFCSLDKTGHVNLEFRQKFVDSFDAHADARCFISEMATCCMRSPNQPISNLLDVIFAKYYPKCRLKILIMIHPANFIISPFNFVYNLFIIIYTSYCNIFIT
jgi:hypothetical protein